MITYFLLGRTVYTIILVVIAFLLSRFIGDIYGRSLLAILLFIVGQGGA